MKSKTFFIIFLFALLTIIKPQNIYADPGIDSIQENINTVGRYEKFEITLEVEAKFSNPYDPEDIDLSAQLISPSGKNYKVNGFYFQNYKRTGNSGMNADKNTCIIKEILEPQGKPVWKIRFTPNEAGLWKYQINLMIKEGFDTTPWRTFRCVESKNPGFIRVEDGSRLRENPLLKKFLPPRDRHYFVFDDGKPYFPIGENLAWPEGQRKTYSYDDWCAALKQNGCNFFRLWFAPWFLALEWKETGLGKYNQERSWDLDYIIDLSQRLDLYFMLCFTDHGQLSVSHNPEWKNNPYNFQNGGPCKTPAEFLTNEKAKKLFKMRLRYIVSRFGFSPNIMAWEWFNEADLSDTNNIDELTAWIKEMNQYLKEIDPYHHMLSTSFHHENPSAVWSSPDISFTQWHIYEIRDYAAEFSQPKYEEMLKKYDKPFLIGEFGWMKDINRLLDKTGLHLHEAIWAGTMSGFGGSPLIWYWDVYVHPNELYYHYKALANFIKGEDLSHHNFYKINLVVLNSKQVTVCGRQNKAKAIFWLRNDDNNLDEYIAYLAEKAKNKIRRERGLETVTVNFPPTQIKDCDIIIKGLSNGDYNIEWWDTIKGEIISRTTAVCRNQRLKLRVPNFSSDIAGKAVRKSFWQGWWSK